MSFLENIKQSSLLAAFERQPGLILWIKDRNGVYQYANNEFLRHFLLSSVDELIGCSDYDLTPKYIADIFIVDDNQVLEGKEIYNRLELVAFKDEKTGWYLTDKIPLRNTKNNIIGTLGMTRKATGKDGFILPDSSIEKVIEYINTNFMKSLSIQHLAGLCCLSVSAFERKFKKYFQITPTEYILKFRVNKACRLLSYTDLTISEIAVECGFCDHSYMTRQFKKLVGCSPSQFRSNL